MRSSVEATRQLVKGDRIDSRNRESRDEVSHLLERTGMSKGLALG